MRFRIVREFNLAGIFAVPTGLATTFEILIASRNEAASPVLLSALESKDATIYDSTLKAIIARRNKSGHLAVLKRWHQLPAQQQEYLQEGRGRMSGALRDAVLSDDDQLFANACELVEKFQEFDLTSTLITLAENQKSKHAEEATHLVLRLIQQLSDFAHSERDPNDRRDPERMCSFVLDSLERSVERYRTHRRDELIEAFVVLGGTHSTVLQEIIEDVYHPCHQTVISTLLNSQSVGVMEILSNSLESDHASLNVLNVISKRNDPQFVAWLLKFTSEGFTANASKNLGRIRSFSWLQAGKRGFNHFNVIAQVMCIRLVAASGVKSDEFLDLLEIILQQGEPEARWAACDALTSISGERGSQLVLHALEDLDAEVQAVATKQIRDRHVPNAMSILMKQLDSPHEVVREVACEALSEFSFENYRVGFDSLNDDVRRTTGALVKKVDSKAPAGLLAEMKSSSRKRRLRALEMAEVMGLVAQLVEGVLLLLKDEDHLVRAAAADILQFCPTSEVQTALRRATHDESGSVQNAAKASLEIFDSLTSAPSDDLVMATEDLR